MEDKGAKSLWLFSLPRSGSSFVAAELQCRTELPYIREPLRRLFKDPTHPLYPSNALGFSGESELMALIPDPRKQGVVSEIIHTVSTGTIVKETEAILQIPSWQTIFPKVPFVYLARHLGGVLASHMSIKNIRDSWRYDERIAATVECLRNSDGKIPHDIDFLEVYSRAEQECIGGEKWLATLTAHIGVQMLQLEFLAQNREITRIAYEDIVDNPEAQFCSLLNAIGIPDKGTRRVYIPGSGASGVHCTKPDTSGQIQQKMGWIAAFEPQDFRAIGRILGSHRETVFPGVKEGNIYPSCVMLSQKFETKPEVPVPKKDVHPSYIKIDLGKSHVLIANGPVTTQEYCNFLNSLSEKGVLTPHELLMELSAKEILFDKRGNTYRANLAAANRPVVYVSLLGACMYALWNQACIGTEQVYCAIHRKWERENRELSGNIGEIQPTTTVPGTYDPVLGGVYDLIGNVRELCIGGDGSQPMTYGGSHRSEADSAQKGIFLPTLLTMGDRDIGFRLMKPYEMPIPPVDCTKYVKDIRDVSSVDALYKLYCQIIAKARLCLE